LRLRRLLLRLPQRLLPLRPMAKRAKRPLLRLQPKPLPATRNKILSHDTFYPYLCFLFSFSGCHAANAARSREAHPVSILAGVKNGGAWITKVATPLT
jgi:hypothetical protein